MVGSGSVLAALIFLFGAMVYREWIPPEKGRFLWDAIAAAYQGYGVGFILMLAAYVGVLIMHERLWWFIVKEKNKEIERIAGERNVLQEIVLRERGSTGSGAKKSKK